MGGEGGGGAASILMGGVFLWVGGVLQCTAGGSDLISDAVMGSLMVGVVIVADVLLLVARIALSEWMSGWEVT